MAKIGRPKRSKDVACVCGTCGLAYTKPDYARTGTRYCSKQCFWLSRRGRPRPDLRTDPVPVECGACGKTFLTGGAGRRPYGRKFCSTTCLGVGHSKQPDLRAMSAEEIAWLAGLFDGEGNVAWPRKHNLHTARLSVSNTDFRLLHRVIEVTGTGAIVGKTARKKIEHAPVANWSCYGDRAKRLLALMRPWLIVKAEAADIVLLAAAEKRQREMQL